jgi:hypothetical protein
MHLFIYEVIDKKMKIPIILLSFKQLCLLGVQIGHEAKTTFFLSSWMFYA